MGIYHGQAPKKSQPNELTPSSQSRTIRPLRLSNPEQRPPQTNGTPITRLSADLRHNCREPYRHTTLSTSEHSTHGTSSSSSPEVGNTGQCAKGVVCTRILAIVRVLDDGGRSLWTKIAGRSWGRRERKSRRAIHRITRAKSLRPTSSSS